MPRQPRSTTAQPDKPAKRPPPRPTKKGKERSQADNLWKEVLDDFLERFMLLTFEDYHAEIDWDKGYLSLDKEMIEVSEQAGFGSQSADKLFKVFLKDGSESLLLLHIEVQNYKDENFAHRVYDYNDLIGRKYNLEVESFAVLSDPDPNFRPSFYLRQRKRKRLLFEFEMVKLLDWWQRWQELEQSDNPFALVVMAHLKTQQLKRRPIELKEMKIQLIRLLFERGFSREYVIKLFRTIGSVVRLPPDMQAEFQTQVRSEFYGKEKIVRLSSFEREAQEKGLKQGRQEGLQEGMLTFALPWIEQRFGSIEPELKQQLEALNATQLQKLGKQLLSLSNKADLINWLKSKAVVGATVNS